MYNRRVGQAQVPFRCKLIVWDRAIDLCSAVYALTRKFPREEIYGITSQIRRASVSIPSNIAEGYGRGTREQYKQFLSIALGSYMELQTQLVIARRLGFVECLSLRKSRASRQRWSECCRRWSLVCGQLQTLNPKP